MKVIEAVLLKEATIILKKSQQIDKNALFNRSHLLSAFVLWNNMNLIESKCSLGNSKQIIVLKQIARMCLTATTAISIGNRKGEQK